MNRLPHMTELLKTLNPQQREAVEYTDGPQLIIAGAGSGKTRVLITKIAYLCTEHGIAPEKILAITFSNKAAQEMQKRIAPYNLYPTMGTFHAVCLRILRSHGRYIGLGGNLIVCDAQDQIEMIRESLDELGLDGKTYPAPAVAEWISRMKDDLRTPDAGNTDNPAYHSVYALYEKKLSANNAVDFGGLILKTVELLREFPDLRRYYYKKYSHIFVDEYQDTNTAQAVFLRLLAGDNTFVCVVGDPDQSIYGWRGANIQNILLFEESFPGAKLFKLEQNYRSTQIILDATNLLIKTNAGRREKALWTDRQGGRKISFQRFATDRQEAKEIVNHIEKYHNNGMLYGDMAVFYRTHNLSRTVEEELLRHGIPYTVIGGLPFYQRREVKDIVSYLRVIVNPEDRISWKRILNVPPRRIGKQTLMRIMHLNDISGNSFYSELRNHASIPRLTRQAHAALDFLLERVSFYQTQLESQPWDDIARGIISDIGYMEYLENAELPEKTAVRTANIATLIEALAEYQQEHKENDMASFLEHIALRSGIDEWADGEDRVTLMTLHCAKGLEFPAVFIIGMEDGMLPYRRDLDDPDEIEEERRLCYVGMTRAIDYLHLSSSQQRFSYSQPVIAPPSRFIGELPIGLLEYADFSQQAQNTSKFYSKENVSASDPAFNAFIDHFAPGDRVYHCDIGKGTILGGSGSGEKKKYIILFDGDTDPMIVYASFAGLTKIE